MPGSLVTSFIEAVVAKDLDEASSFLADDVEYDNVPLGKVHGKDGFRAVLGPFLDGAAEVDWVVHHQVASGDLEHGVVMNERVDRFRLATGWMEVPVAGLFVVEHGLITLWRDYFDRAGFDEQVAAASG